MGALKIGDLARLSGARTPTIRWYEKAGMMPAPDRNMGNQRRYGPEHLRRLQFIRRGRELGFSLDDIRGLLALANRQEAPCRDADRIARLHLSAVKGKIAQLKELQRELERMLESRHGTVADCQVIESLIAPGSSFSEDEASDQRR